MIKNDAKSMKKKVNVWGEMSCCERHEKRLKWGELNSEFMNFNNSIIPRCPTGWGSQSKS